MPAYWLARSKINDPVAYKKYTDEVPGILKKYGGRPFARGGEFKVLEGDTPYERFIVVEFDSMADAEACFNSPEYVEAAAHRRVAGVATNELVIVEGGDATPALGKLGKQSGKSCATCRAHTTLCDQAGHQPRRCDIERIIPG